MATGHGASYSLKRQPVMSPQREAPADVIGNAIRAEQAGESAVEYSGPEPAKLKAATRDVVTERRRWRRAYAPAPRTHDGSVVPSGSFDLRFLLFRDARLRF